MSHAKHPHNRSERRRADRRFRDRVKSMFRRPEHHERNEKREWLDALNDQAEPNPNA